MAMCRLADRTAFLCLLFSPSEPVTTGDSELVAGRWSRVELHRERGLMVLVAA